MRDPADFYAAHIAVLEDVATGDPSAQILESIVSMVERQSDDMLCSILLFDEEHQCMRHGAAPSLPADYSRALDGARVGPMEGSCGAAAARRVTVIVEDIATHPNWAVYKNLALPFGLRACWSTPIFGSDRSLLGTFAMYSREPRGPTEPERRWVATATHVAALAIMRERAAAVERERKRLVMDLKDRVQELTLLQERLGILYRLGEAMREVIEPDEVLPVALRMLGEHLGTTRCQYADVDPDEEGITIPHDWTDGVPNMVGRYRLSDFGEGVAGPLRSEAGPLIITDVDADLPAKDAATLSSLGIKAFVACSLIRQGRLRALMSVHQDVPRAWTPNDVAIVESFVERCWVTIEQRAAEAQIRRQGSLLRIAGQAAKLGGWSLELPSHELAWSDEVCAIHEVPAGTKRSLAQAIGYYAPENREAIQAALEGCLDHGKPFDLELQIVTATGRRSWVRAMGHAERGADGAVVGIQGALQDVNDRHLLEDQFRQAQKMEAVGQLAGGVAHDFNNLLSVVLSSADFAAGALPEGAEARADIEEIRAAGRRAAELTKQLLTFSRKQVVTPTVLDLNKVVKDVERMLRRLLRADIGCAIVADETLGHVRADRGQLEQVIVNLVVNARDAMPAGGSVTIETANVTLDESYASRHHGVVPGDYAMLAVADTGIGMDSVTVTRIFEPFFTTKDKGKGTGLGLATVYGIVTASGGHVNVESELGRGTTFQVYLPRVDEAADALDEADDLSDQELRGSETILVVEDAEQVRSIVRSILRRSGYQVLEAENAGEAILVCEQHPSTIDLLLTDVVLPRVGGRELAERLRADRPHLSVLYTSGYSGEAALQQSVVEPGASFLPKPITPDSLLRAVRRALDRTPRSSVQSA